MIKNLTPRGFDMNFVQGPGNDRGGRTGVQDIGSQATE
jgi:hypothetical protein